MFTDIVILAGGFGERLWPASQPDCPKQFMTLGNGVSFLQSSVQRALALRPEGRIIIVTRRELLGMTADHCRLLAENPQTTPADKEKIKRDLVIIPEPAPKHTTAPIALSAHYAKLRAPGTRRTLLVLTSDHVIGPVEAFTADSARAAEAAEAGNFVCYAIPPTEPATGYGYIRAGEPLDKDGHVFRIAQFKEKPDAATAEAYLKSGGYWWSSGMFGFDADLFLAELAACTPEAAAAFHCVRDGEPPQTGKSGGIQYIERWAEMDRAYAAVPAVAVDIAVSEKTSRAAAVRATFSWNDVGSWDAFEKLSAQNSGRTIEIQGMNNFVYSDIPVALCGVENLVIVIKNGSALVMRKGSSDLVRQAAQALRGSA